MTKKRHKKKGEKRKVRNTDEVVAIPDLSLKDFADANEPKQRYRKNVQGFLNSNLIDHETAQDQAGSDLLWYEKDFDIPEPSGEGEENVNATELKNVLKSGMKRKKKMKDMKSNTFSGELVFPDDLWYLLSMFIRPEDVLRFSLICKGARNAVSSVRFWMRNYSIYVQDSDKLPASLRRDRIDCRPGLRARAVRALFYNYDVLKRKLTVKVQGSSCLEALLFWTCTSMWFHQMSTRKDTKIWMFYFKFCQRKDLSSLKHIRFTKEWIDSADFVRDNPEEGYPVLAVSCLNFISFRPVLGMVLSQGSVGISGNMKNSRVKLMFHNQRERDKKYRPESGYQVVLDPVLDVTVLHWWHPLYPHQDT